MFKSNCRKFCLVLPLLIGLVGGCSESVALHETQIVIDTTREFQTISGWEVTTRLWEFDKHGDRFDSSWEALSDPVFQKLIEQGGINRIRLELKSGFENPVDYWQKFVSGEIGYKEYKAKFYEKINDNNDPKVINAGGFNFSALDYTVEKMLLPMQRLLQARGERLIINLCYVDFKHSDASSTLFHAREPEEYAELVEAAFIHLKQKYQIEPDFFELILEPDLTLGWRGENIGHGLIAVHKRLSAAGFTPRYIAPSTSRLYQATRYFDQLITVDGTAELLDSYSFHRYHSKYIPLWLQHHILTGIASRAQANGISTSMLEYLQGDVDQLLDDLTLANITAWQIWGIAYKVPELAEQNGAMLLVKDDGDAASPAIVLSQNAVLVSPYFREIRENAVRVDAQSNDDAARVVAFKQPNNGFSALVYLKNDSAQTLSISGLMSGQYAVNLTRLSGSVEDLGVVTVADGKPAIIAIPHAGVVTFSAPVYKPVNGEAANSIHSLPKSAGINAAVSTARES